MKHMQVDSPLQTCVKLIKNDTMAVELMKNAKSRSTIQLSGEKSCVALVSQDMVVKTATVQRKSYEMDSD